MFSIDKLLLRIDEPHTVVVCDRGEAAVGRHVDHRDDSAVRVHKTTTV